MTSLRVLALILKNDQILLAMKKRGFGAGYYNGPGGKLESGETLEQALVRECQEEVSLTPLSWDKAAVLDFGFPGRELDMQVHAYICRNWQGEPVESEEMAPQWFAAKDIPYDQMWQDDIIWLPGALAGHKMIGRFIFSDSEHMLSAELDFVEGL